VVVEALEASALETRFRAAALYLEAAREWPAVSARTNGAAAVDVPGAATSPTPSRLTGTPPTAPKVRKPAANHPWRQWRRLSQSKGARAAREYRRKKAEEREEEKAGAASSGLARGGRWPRASGSSGADPE
jgi:Mg-chelatase subunit ChlI